MNTPFCKNKSSESPFNIVKNQEFEPITSHHFTNLISPSHMEQSVESNSFEKFKAIASLPILFVHISDFFKKRFLCIYLSKGFSSLWQLHQERLAYKSVKGIMKLLKL